MIEWKTDVGEARWLKARIRGFAEDVGSVVPHGYESYARILHPLDGLVCSRWEDLAASNGQIAHSGMQYDFISRPPGSRAHHHEHLRHMAIGVLPHEQLRLLVDVLVRHTPADEPCSFAIWDGYGQLQGGRAVTIISSGGATHPPGLAPPEVLAGPRLELPYRSYLLLSGSLLEVLALRHVVDHESPNLWWPNDRSWCVATEIDFGWTYVAGPEALISDLLASPALEVWRCQVGDRIRDLLNAAVDEHLPGDGGSDG